MYRKLDLVSFVFFSILSVLLKREERIRLIRFAFFFFLLVRNHRNTVEVIIIVGIVVDIHLLREILRQSLDQLQHRRLRHHHHHRRLLHQTKNERRKRRRTQTIRRRKILNHPSEFTEDKR